MADRSRLLIDATATPEDLGGVGRYVVALVRALTDLGAAPRVVCQARDVGRFRDAGAAQVYAAPPAAARAPGRFVWEQLGLPRLVRRERIDVLHSPHYTFPLLSRARRVVTVHDLTFFSNPELHGRIKRRFFRAWIRLSRTFRVGVVAPSAFTKSEYVRVTGASASRVVVALHGYDPSLFHAPTPGSVKAFTESVGAPDAGWVAFLGTLEPRKNVPALISAYESAVRGLAPVERPALLLAGGPGWDAEVAPAIARALSAGLDVRAIGYLALADLPAFLGGAQVVAYPSLGEGFGLPVLEAMACGAAVLTTRRPALPEVGGDAVAYADVDAASLADRLSEVLGDDALRARLAADGIVRAREFTWERSARAHLDAYASAATARGAS